MHQGTLERSKWFLRVSLWAVVTPFLMNTAGWMLTENGRQPWIVQGLMKTINANSPSVSSTDIWISLIAFVLIYIALGAADLRPDAALRAQRSWSMTDDDADQPGAPGTGADHDPGADLLGVTVHLHTIWFVIIAIFWVGFFVLEGFDFGVGVLHTIVGKTDAERRVALNTIGPWWDGNEVWLIVAGAGTFAAFPGWYATMFSALYLALLLVLVALMARGVAFEFKGKGDGQRWRATWMWCTTLGSLLIPLLLGVGLGDLLVGLPINSSHDFTGNFFDLLTPYGLWTGVTLLGLCLLHGATFLKLQDHRSSCASARASLARPLGWAAIALVVGCVIWTRSVAGGPDVPEPGRGPRADRRHLRRATGDAPTTTAGRSRPRRSRSPRRSARSSSTCTRT